jgi:hypothetical protein
MEERKFQIKFDKGVDHSIQYLIGILTDARTVTLNLVKKLTAEEVDWQYEPGWNTIGALLDHIAAVQQFFRIEYVEERKLTEEENNQLLPALDMGIHLPELIGIRSIEEYYKSLTDSHELLLSALQKIGFEDFVRVRPGYDEVEGCNLAWVLYHMVEDEIYHRGQISLIRKLFKTQHNQLV